MKHSAGLSIITKDKKILLVKPKNAKWWKSYSIPKGHLEEGETPLEAAIRETFEEIGIKILPSMVSNKERIILYPNGSKKVTYFEVRINSYKDLGLDSEIIPKNKLQSEEIEWAGFLNKNEAIPRIMPAMELILNDI